MGGGKPEAKSPKSPNDNGGLGSKNVSSRRNVLQEKKDRGALKNALFKVGESIGVVEQMHLAPEFLQEISSYFTYQDVIDGLIDRLEGILQQNPEVLNTGAIEATEKQNPYEVFATNVKRFRACFTNDQQKESLVTVESILKRLALYDREAQLKGRRAVRKMRRFVSSEKESMDEEQKKLLVALEMMDAARYELKETKTMEHLEQKGKLYERSVHEFNEQAEKVHGFIQKMPEDKTNHQREVVELFEVLSHTHRQLAASLVTHLVTLGIRVKHSSKK
ncbi:hypothetical protein L596_014873 [Steinernema carpocapsae]|uniref:BAR domain-containing protein n=1 Tax=Steinernema carpocapsae TaxID=34508 RepID=A0A4U5NE26_STECR|nr:hypothetical protein L596_014873 [Steinernema carpocapsae]